MEELKEPFYKKIIASIKDFDKYQEFATQNVNSGIKYFLKLLLLLTIVAAVTFTVKAGQTITQTVNYLRNESPNFKYEDGTLDVDSSEAIIYEDSNNFNGIIIVDTNSEISEEKLSEYKKKFALYNNGILILREKITVKNELINEEVTQTYKEIFTHYNIGNFDKENIVSYITTSKMITVYASIFLSLVLVFAMLYLLELLLEAVTPMIFGYIAARFIGLKLKASNMFNITVHAMTLSVVLRIFYIIINVATGFYIKYFDTMYITLIYIYVITALFIIRSNLIKQQIELMKIIEEQKNVKQEIKEQDNREKENNEEKEEKDKPKKEDKEEKDNNIGKEANGEV